MRGLVEMNGAIESQRSETMYKMIGFDTEKCDHCANHECEGCPEKCRVERGQFLMFVPMGVPHD